MADGFYGSTYDRYIPRTDDSKTHKLTKGFWTTKQALIAKFGRKQDENIVASDADLDSKLELLKSIQKTCRDLSNLIARYQETVCYLSQSENEMGRFLKRYSLEDKTQAGKIMSAAGKALSHSAQQRLLLRSPLDRVLQEVKTFRQRAISDTLGTLKSMEDTRTEYRGALLWMKHVSEELDPDTYKQLEKFRRVQAQVRKSKTAFDRLKIDSMQKIDLLSASRCNMLSHVLVGYQNSLLTFLEKSSRTMIAVADRFKGYQYYEFSVLKHLRPESKKLAGVNGSDDVDSMFQSSDDISDTSEGAGHTHTPPGLLADHHSDGYNTVATTDLLGLSPPHTGQAVYRSAEQNDNRSPQSSTTTATEVGVTEDELDRRLDEIFQADDVGGSKSDDLPLFGLEDVEKCLNDHSLALVWVLVVHRADLLTGTDSVPAEHRELLTDLFAMEESDFGQQSNQPGYVASSSRWDGSDLDTLGVFGGLTAKSSLETHLGSASGETRTVCEGTKPEQHSSAQEDDPWSDFQMSESCALPSQLLDRRDAYGTNSSTTVMKLGDPTLRSGSVPSVPTGPASSISRPSQQPTAMDAWMNLFSDLGQIGNPDSISKKEGQIYDA
ncbi:hypothetical protein P879_06718 [Paragonimus westermani]|uniref:AH domain-containing protein n=1 Tax=Paragonimus westermani TaxID=34504 RepID=A0A8T0D194_9TREM|nr:hypothetical protein P879_06718 [Paragonimus westermani]